MAAIQEKSFVRIEVELAYAEGYNFFVDGLIVVEHDGMNCVEGGMIEVPAVWIRDAGLSLKINVSASPNGPGCRREGFDEMPVRSDQADSQAHGRRNRGLIRDGTSDMDARRTR